MFWGIAQLLDLIIFHRLHFFFVFFSYVWILFLIKLYYARKYKPFMEPYETSVSVIVPVYHEERRNLDDLLSSLLSAEGVTEILLMVDPRDVETFKYLQEKQLPPHVKTILVGGIGKRNAVAEGIKKASGEIVVIMDSDTRLESTSTIRELVKPFKDPAVGGVTTNQRIKMSNPPWIKERIADWMESMRCHLSFPAMSVKGVIGCLPGRCIAFRKEVLLPYLDSEFLNEYFLGVRCETSDDRCLTNIVLRHGYKTVYQSTAKVVTTVPKSWRKFTKQQLRWLRGSRRETIANLKWMLKKPFILPLVFISDLLVPILYALVVLNMFLNIVFAHDLTLIVAGTVFQTLLGGLLLGLLGAIISLGLRQTPHLRRHKKDLILLPVYICWLTFILTPLSLFALVTLKEQAWLTR